VRWNQWLLGGSISIAIGGLCGIVAKHVASAAPAGSVPISIGDTMRGRLESGDGRLPSGEMADEFRVRLSSARTVSFTTMPDGTRLRDLLRRSISTSLLRGEIVVATDDASSGSGERQIVFTPDSGGIYVFRVAAREVDSSPIGYVVRTSEEPGPKPAGFRDGR
jgi:hypothetical protein